jgi:hypothetical protein
VRQPVFVDVDADGDLDPFVAFRDRANALFRNDGGRFTDIAAQCRPADTRQCRRGAVRLDQDGDSTRSSATWTAMRTWAYHNDGGAFTDVPAGPRSRGCATRDPANGTVRLRGRRERRRPPRLFANYGGTAYSAAPTVRRRVVRMGRRIDAATIRAPSPTSITTAVSIST